MYNMHLSDEIINNSDIINFLLFQNNYVNKVILNINIFESHHIRIDNNFITSLHNTSHFN